MRLNACFKSMLVAEILLASVIGFAAEKQSVADVIYVNGNIYQGAGVAVTRNGTLPPWISGFSVGNAQALAVKDGKIIAIGSDSDTQKFAGKNTKIIDLQGQFAMPGFNDAHVHLWSGGLEQLHINLLGTKSLGEMKQRIAERSRKAEPGEWLTGSGWDHTFWPGQQLPTRQDLDAVTGEHPAIFVRVDGHICVVNSAALKFAGITRATPDPPGGKIDHDASGEPTGILRERAREDLESKLPPPTAAQRRRAAELGLADAARWGVTSVQESIVNPQDASEWQFFLIYEELEKTGKLTARMTEWLPFDAPLAVLEEHRAHHPQNDPMLHTGMLKAFMDGSLGSRTAALLAPYADDPQNSGIVRYQQDTLNRMARERALAGFQMGFHAIGDRAAQMALDAFVQAERAVQEKDPASKPHDFRFRIEHAQVVTPQQIEQFRTLGVIASMQPSHLLTDMNWAEARLGAERTKSSYAWLEFLKNGVPLAFGTDYPVEPITPFRGIYSAITRKNEAGTREYYPQQKLTIEEAIAAYTTGAAYAEFAEKEKGTLLPGMLADFIVLDRDITKIKPQEILQTKVLRTVVGGKTVYEAHP